MVELSPPASVAVSVTAYTPGTAYRCCGAASTETFASILRAALPHAAATTPAPSGVVYRIGA